MIFVARILYEDQRNEARQYPLHTLVCAMADDQLEKTGLRFALGLVDGVPRNGKNKLLHDRGERVDQAFAGLDPEQNEQPRGHHAAAIDHARQERHAAAPSTLARTEHRGWRPIDGSSSGVDGKPRDGGTDFPA